MLRKKDSGVHGIKEMREKGGRQDLCVFRRHYVPAAQRENPLVPPTQIANQKKYSPIIFGIIFRFFFSVLLFDEQLISYIYIYIFFSSSSYSGLIFFSHALLLLFQCCERALCCFAIGCSYRFSAKLFRVLKIIVFMKGFNLMSHRAPV